MKNPLRKRFLRELKQDFGKYAVIFLFITLTIGFISGFLVADNSMTLGRRMRRMLCRPLWLCK